MTSLRQIYATQGGEAAPVSAELVGDTASAGARSPAPTGATPRRRMILDPQAYTVLASGASDLLGLGTDSGKAPHSPRGVVTTEDEKKQLESGWRLVREFIHSQGDRTVHFSAEISEVLGNLPIKRFVIVTENAIYRIPHSTIDTGIFFECRTTLDSVSQVITQDAKLGEGASGVIDAQVQYYTLKAANANASASKQRTEKDNLPFFTLSFGVEASKRKALLLAMCAARPTLSILQKRSVLTEEESIQTASGKKIRKIKSPRTAQYASPKNRENAARRLQMNSQSPAATSPGAVSNPRSGRGGSIDSSSTSKAPAVEIGEEEFATQQAMLRNLLQETSANGICDYDEEKVARRPAEEDESRREERELIKAELESREAKMLQNIQFKVKYPQKVPTRVPPGVEFDKAHEERLVLPDEFTDEELLGPSLYPLWETWKNTGGLMGTDGIPTDWTLYDSQDLIDSLRSREEVLFGVVGKLSLRRIASMCELVDRERQMFLNKKAFHEREALREEEFLSSRGSSAIPDDEEDDGMETPQRYTGASPSPYRSQSRVRGVPPLQRKEVTQVTPFRLSQSPTALRKLKIIDSKKLVADMKQNFEKHLKAMHELQKEQLEHQLNRVTSETDN